MLFFRREKLTNWILFLLKFLSMHFHSLELQNNYWRKISSDCSYSKQCVKQCASGIFMLALWEAEAELNAIEVTLW